MIGKCIIKRLENDRRFNTKLCLGQKCGNEHAIHFLRSQNEKPEYEAVLLIDAKNDFNYLNRNLAVENIKKVCSFLTIVVQNSYSAPSNLYAACRTRHSLEGTIQGHPNAMAR